MVDEFQDALAVGDTRSGSLHIFFIQRMRQPITLRFPHVCVTSNRNMADERRLAVQGLRRHDFTRRGRILRGLGAAKDQTVAPLASLLAS